jgi:hypothetical protein
MFPVRITFAHLPICSAMDPPNWAGVIGIGVAPRSTNRSTRLESVSRDRDIKKSPDQVDMPKGDLVATTAVLVYVSLILFACSFSDCNCVLMNSF